MRTYVAITGIIFALMFIAHAARVVVEGAGILQDPTIIVTSVIAIGFAIWSVFLLIKRP